MTALEGEVVTFSVTNTGAMLHEFYLGDAEAQAVHEADVAATGGLPMDGPKGIAVDPGATEQITYVFPTAGEWLAGCHVTNHYVGGMRAAISVVAR